MLMTQDEQWMARYNEVAAFIERERRNPSKYAPEERRMVHFLKRGRKLVNAGEMKGERLVLFERLLGMCEEYKRKNQYR